MKVTKCSRTMSAIIIAVKFAFLRFAETIAKPHGAFDAHCTIFTAFYQLSRHGAIITIHNWPFDERRLYEYYRKFFALVIIDF